MDVFHKDALVYLPSFLPTQCSTNTRSMSPYFRPRESQVLNWKWR